MFDYQRPEWQKDAACRGMDINLFFPRRGETKQTREAKKICESCPVINECREYSFELAQHFETVGIFGGMATRNRQNALSAMGIKAVYRQSYTAYQD